MHNREIGAPVPSKPRILLVGDEAVLRGHVARVVSDGYIVDTAGNGQEALECVIRSTPALVVMRCKACCEGGVEAAGPSLRS